MKILLIAATEQEVMPFLRLPADQRQNVDILITGVGMTATAFALGHKLAGKQVDLLLNVGIAGSFRRDIALGDVVRVYRDTFAELGAEDGGAFIDLETLGLGAATFEPRYPFSTPSVETLLRCEGITVNKVHGDEQTIANTVGRIAPDTESMEGAAVFYASQQTGIPALQVRAISNYVARRNRQSWQVTLAIHNLCHWLADFAKSPV